MILFVCFKISISCKPSTIFGGIVIICGSAFAIFKLKNLVPNNLLKKFFSKFKVYLFSVFFIVLILGFVFGAYVAPSSYTQTLDDAPLMKEMFSVWDYIKVNIPKEEARIFNQNLFDNVKEPLITSDSIASGLAPLYTNFHHFFGSWYTTLNKLEPVVHSDGGFIFGKKIGDISQEELMQNFKKFNIKYVIAVEPILQNKLNNSNYKILKQTEHLKLFEINNYNASWFIFQGKVDIIYFGSQEVRFSTSSVASSELIFKMAYHPYWKAYVDNKEVKVFSDEDLIALDVPAGNHVIVLHFEPKNWLHISISFIALGIVLLLLWPVGKIMF